MTDILLSKIYIYPIKSLRGIEVSEWQVDAKGLVLDRRWMLIDTQHQFLSQRTLPRMALIQTALIDATFILSAPDMPDLHVALEQYSEEIITAQIWHDQCLTHVVSAAADQWFSQFLGIDCRLVYQPDASVRAVDPNYAEASDETSLSDGFPFLLVAENSLHALNNQLSHAIEMQRFRPNLVVSGCAAYAEDSWREISVGNIRFRLPKPCSRCSVPNVDPVTAIIGKEPLHTLNSYRKWQNKVYFGQNALHNSIGMLCQHMPVHVLQTGSPQPPL